ncbi:VOC family protein [Streptomyces sp. ISL-94]|uniref:VOC family protein n=1 Tax=Streptomyces sp. ISL-94 TaxID=2819190 RepID=UPI001BE4EF6C|nr:VOC family protein [Streptomyces sp. ISL-94]MBT2478000.1 VOC family protein [Streptomyces sp. ISL-94]
MPSRLNPYISFDGDARQAMEFYQGIFGGSLKTNTYGEFGTKEAGDAADRIMHSMLETDSGFTLMGADNPPGQQHKPGNNISVSVSGEDADELRGYWDKLSAGGTVAVPLEEQMWGDVFGMCTDRFGITWLVNINQRQG